MEGVVIQTHMETNHGASTTTKKAALGGLAVVGFIALILIGIATAIYAASFLPKALTRLSSANVYLSSLTQTGGSNQLEPVQQPATQVIYTPAPTANTIPFGTTTTTTTVTPPVTVTPPTTTTTVTTPVTPTYVPPRTTPTYRVVQVPASQNYSGLPDLVATITSVGYLRNDGDTSSFVAANTVPSGRQGAVRFVIANRGTNVTGSWNFEADLPNSSSNSNYRSSSQQSLKPGDSIVYTLGYDNSTRGSDTFRVEADSSRNVSESNESNNTDSESIYFNGTSSSNNSGSDYDSNGNYCRNGTYYSNGRYYCETSSSSNNNHDSYDSNGKYCSNGTYYSSGRYYCETSSNSNTSSYDSNGNYCRYGTYTQNGRRYCETQSNTNGSYDSDGNYCRYGTYYQNQHYYCY